MIIKELKNKKMSNNNSSEETQQSQNGKIEEVQIVVFILDDERYGVEISQVKEITAATNFTIIPNSPTYILGLLDLRGEIVVLIDLEKKFELERKNQAEKSHIVVCSSENGKIGIVVDRVEKIITVTKDELKDPEGIVKQKISPEFVPGVLVYENEVLIVLDVKEILQKKELEVFQEQNE